MKHHLPSLILILAVGCSNDDADEGTGTDTDSTSATDTDTDSDTDTDTDSDTDTDTDLPFCDDGNHAGEGTYYDADGSGNCSFPPSPGDLMVAAMNHNDYRLSSACGTCVHAVGPEGEVTVRIVDRCPECATGDLDFSPQAFEVLAPLPQGRISINWTYVPCAVTGPIVYYFDPGSNQWWSSIQVRNHRHEIARFEAQDESGSFHVLDRENHNFFVHTSGLGPGPYALRITDIYDQVLTDTDIPFQAGEAVPGAAQFPSICTP